MHYTQLPPTYKDDTIAQALYAREVEYFHYEFDAANFVHILAATPPGPYRDGVEKLLTDTREQMARVQATYDALQAQITDPVAHADAVARAIKSREATP